MSDKLTAWLRTIVPAAWSAAIAYLVTLGLPASFTAPLSGLGEVVIVPIVLGAVYAALRWVEPRLPDWLTRVVLGSAQQPLYGQLASDGTPVITTAGQHELRPLSSGGPVTPGDSAGLS